MQENDTKSRTTTHDQNFKNLILDYPYDSLRFFAAKEAFDLTPDVDIIPVRQEQLKDRLGDHFHEVDTPMLLQWPDGRREAAVFLFEEESKPSDFSIHRTGRYCLHLSELLETDRVIPIVIFLRPGKYRPSLTLGGDWNTYIFVRFIPCDLGRIPAENYMNSDNIVARLNLPNMAYPADRKIDVYAGARDGLVELEQKFEKQKKYAEFIDLYSKLDETEFIRYMEEYLPKSPRKEAIMGLTQMLINEGFQKGMQQEMQKGMRQGVQKGNRQGEISILIFFISGKTLPIHCELLS